MKDLYRGKKPNAAFGVAWFFSRKLANPHRWCSIACSRRLFARYRGKKPNTAFGVACFFARVHYIISSRIRAIALFILLRRIFVR